MNDDRSHRAPNGMVLGSRIRSALIALPTFGLVAASSCSTSTFDVLSTEGIERVTPTLQLAPMSVEFAQPIDGDCPRDLTDVTITNSGPDDLEFTVTPGGKRVKVAPSSGVVRSGSKLEVQVTFECVDVPRSGGRFAEILEFHFPKASSEPGQLFVHGQFVDD